MKFTVFNEHGEIDHTMDCDEEDLVLNVQTGQRYVVGELSGVCLDAKGQVLDKPAQPTPAHEWFNFGWVLSETRVAELQATADAQAVNQARADKAQALAAIVVTTSTGKSFDGNETARNNMQQALTAAQLTGTTSIFWKLADNSLAEVGVDEVGEALVLSIQRVGRIVTGNY